jgi:hypothetical protein
MSVLQTDYVFGAHMRPDFTAAQRRLEVQQPGAVQDVLSVDWLRQMHAAQKLIDKE